MPKFTSAIVAAIALTLVPASVPAGAQDAKPKIVRSKPVQPDTFSARKAQATSTSARSTAMRSCAMPT